MTQDDEFIMVEKIAPTEVPIHGLLAGRWSPRAYSEKPVTREHLHAVLEAARWAPSSYNVQPWRFIVFDRSVDALAYKEAFATLAPLNQGWNVPVPILIAVTTRTSTAKGDVNRCAQYDAGAAAMALVLQAHALGLAAHQMSTLDVDDFRHKFSIPKDVDVMAVIALGHFGDVASLAPAYRDREQAPRTRLPLSEIVFDGEWGRAF